MPKQKSLFENDEDKPHGQSTELTITAQKLGPEQQLFNQLLEKARPCKTSRRLQRRTKKSAKPS
jgi:hypothetical protein